MPGDGQTVSATVVADQCLPVSARACQHEIQEALLHRKKTPGKAQGEKFACCKGTRSNAEWRIFRRNLQGWSCFSIQWCYYLSL